MLNLHCVLLECIWHHDMYYSYAGKYSWFGLQDAGSHGNW